MAEESSNVWKFDMEQHAMVVAFPLGMVDGVDEPVVTPPVFVTNLATCAEHAPQLIEAALLFALDVVRNGQYREVDAEMPTDLSSLKEKP
jgi:hypothetical protein